MRITELVPGAKKAADLRGKRKTAFYEEVRDGLMTRPVKNGVRAVVWPLHEIERINAARVAGKSDDEIRTIVAELHAARNRAA